MSSRRSCRTTGLRFTRIMGRHKKPVAGQHVHCETCFSRHCTVTVSCAVISCRLHCGAVFHMCKQEEHQLLCPLESVPCLNAANGCPFAIPRRRLAWHLERCPASVVSCSLDWNRWPVAESDGALYQNLPADPRAKEQLDLSMAMRDQALLFRSLKMETLFPELMEREEEPVVSEEDQGAVGGGAIVGMASAGPEGPLEQGFVNTEELTQEECDAIGKNREVVGMENFASWDAIFSKEWGGCQQAAKNLGNNPKASDNKMNTVPVSEQLVNGECATEHHEREPIAAVDETKIGLAPWQDGVLERLGKEVNSAEYNMYLVHHGSMLIRFGQLDACTPKERDFVYGGLEPIEVKSIQSFNVPYSYKAKCSRLRDPSTRAKCEDKGVNTSRWVGENSADAPEMDEVEMTLLCSLEKELRGHVISESVGTDGLFVDVGTQTYTFPSSPFRAGMSLADVVGGDRTPGLHVQIQTESVTRRHNKSTSAFTFLCGHAFRRDEFPIHFKNTHSDIQSCLSGWFEQRCPLAYLGCTYSQKRFRPSSHGATVTYDPEASAFNLRPDVPATLSEDPAGNCLNGADARILGSLSDLPFEILRHVAGFLDSFSLSQLARTSRLLRDVCATLLQDRGMVTLRWEKGTDSHGGSSWRCKKKVWQFSGLFSPVERWSFDRTPSMSEHLKACSFYQTEGKSQPFALLGLSDCQEQDRVRKGLLHTLLNK